MILKTRLFGEVEVKDEEVIHFTKPILGFDDCRQYLLMENESIFPTFWLQSINDPNLAFPVVSPFSVDDNYSINLHNLDIDDINLKSLDEALVLTLMVVPQTLSSIRTNLRAPIIYNPEKRIAKQLILYDEKYPIHYYVMDDANN